MKLPPEPGTVAEPDHGIPGPAEDLPDDDHEAGERLLAELDEEED